MTYSANGLIQALDFNGLVGPSATTSTTANAVNTIWGTGSREWGYGQTVIPNISANSIVQSENWASLINTINSIATHQGTTFTTALTPPVDNEKITYLASLKNNLNKVYDRRNNAAAQGLTQSTSTRFTTSAWHNSITFKFTVTFSTGDKARYFFNSGGQIAINFTHAATGGINTIFNSLCADCGTIILSAMTGTQQATIAGTTYTGTTRVGGTGDATNLNTTLGYYSLTANDQLLFRKNPNKAGISPSFLEYVASTISVYAKISGSQGQNGDVGSTITITAVWEQSPNTENVSPGNNTGPVNNSTTTVSVRYPKSTVSGGVLTNTWGTATVDGSVIGN